MSMTTADRDVIRAHKSPPSFARPMREHLCTGTFMRTVKISGLSTRTSHCATRTPRQRPRASGLFRLAGCLHSVQDTYNAVGSSRVVRLLRITCGTDAVRWYVCRVVTMLRERAIDKDQLSGRSAPASPAAGPGHCGQDSGNITVCLLVASTAL